METAPSGPPPVTPPLVAPVEHGEVAGFWVRVLSDVIDAVVLGVAGLLLALPLRSVFERLGERGVFIGLAISLAYAGVLQSRIGRGQTIGKKLLGLRVVKLDGSLVSLDRSLVRYALVAFPVYQTAVVYAIVTLLPFVRLEWLQALQGGLGLTLFLGCFLVIPLHPLKRGLHDLVTGTVVTRRGPLHPAFVAAKTDVRRDRRILAGALALTLAGTAAGAAMAGRGRATAAAPATTEAAAALGMTNVTMADFVFPDPQRTERRIVAGFLPMPPDGGTPDWLGAQQRLQAALVQDTPPSTDKSTIVTIALRTGFNIGIARSYETRIVTLNLATGKPQAGPTATSYNAGF